MCAEQYEGDVVADATARFVQKHTTLQKFFFLIFPPAKKRVYAANSGDVFSFTLSHPAAESAIKDSEIRHVVGRRIQL